MALEQIPAKWAACMLFLAAFSIANLFPPVASARELPDVLVFISDDLGRGDTSIHGSKDARTPHLKELAAGGMVFDNAYVASPSCCPNRYSLLTGLMPARHGAHANHTLVKPGTKFLLPEIQKLGYFVASVGKVAHGRFRAPGIDFYSFQPVNLSTQVKKFLADYKQKKPLCLFVGDRRPHVPWTPEMNFDVSKVTLPPHFIDTPETRRHWVRYLTDIAQMDTEMGRIYEMMRARSGDNLLTIFTSDHGGQWPRGKWNLYDEGARIPLVVHWPGQIKSGVRTDAMVSWVDILPTLIELNGGQAPAGIDGRSFAPVLLGKADKHRDRIFTTHTGDGRMNVFPMRSVREGQFKYIRNLRPDAWHTNHSDRHKRDGAGAYWHSWYAAAKEDKRAAGIVERYHTRPAEELFDLKADPLELNNLAKDPAHQKKLQQLKKALETWTTAQGDDLQPHQAPYLRTSPIPELKFIPRKRPIKKPGKPKQNAAASPADVK